MVDFAILTDYKDKNDSGKISRAHNWTENFGKGMW